MVQTLGIASGVLLLLAAGFFARFAYLKRRRRKMQESVREAKQMADEFQFMIGTAGWKRLCQLAAVQVQGRQNEILLQPTENAAKQEYQKGELQGIQLFVKLPELSIEMAKDLMAEAQKLDEEIED